MIDIEYYRHKIFIEKGYFIMKRKDIVVLSSVVANYAFINKPDPDGKYRVSVELEERDIEALSAAVKEAGLEEHLPLDYERGDILTPKSSFEPSVAFDTSVDFGSDIYSGCVVDVIVRPFEYTYKKRKGVSFGLVGIVKRNDGERLDGGVNIADYVDNIQ